MSFTVLLSNQHVGLRCLGISRWARGNAFPGGSAGTEWAAYHGCYITNLTTRAHFSAPILPSVHQGPPLHIETGFWSTSVSAESSPRQTPAGRTCVQCVSTLRVLWSAPSPSQAAACLLLYLHLAFPAACLPFCPCQSWLIG